ncbi:hypothetical protein [Nocardia sp. NPDC051570]|uniref:hypothetical protein n=1 Tax=Nocardia sp. NPDC051570 TaxID=3364324 RepID=UPI00379BCC86
MSSAPRPFRITIPEADLADLAERLDRIRWPDELPGAELRAGRPSPSGVPTAVANFPGDNVIQVLAGLSNVVTRWREYDRGGHFPALQAPEELTSDIREFFRSLPDTL